MKNAAAEKEINIRFEYASTAIHQSTRATLAAFAHELNKPEHSGRTFVIAGHTDAAGNDTYNQRLSERRAEAVKGLLVEQFKLAPARLVTIGYGKTRLKNTAEPMAGENRRVHISETRPSGGAVR